MLYEEQREDEVVIKPEDFIQYKMCSEGLRMDDLDVKETAILCIGKPLFNKIKKMLNAKETLWIPKVGPPLFNGKIGNTEISILRTCIGASSTVFSAELLMASGVKRIFFLGFAGGINTKVKKGCLIIPTGAMRDDGTIVEINDKLYHVLYEACEKLGVSYHKGLVWTTSSIFKETKSKIISFQKKNCIAVDMEVAELYAISHLRKKDSAAVLLVTDNLSNLIYEPYYYDLDEEDKYLSTSANIILEAIRILASK